MKMRSGVKTNAYPRRVGLGGMSLCQLLHVRRPNKCEQYTWILTSGRLFCTDIEIAGRKLRKNKNVPASKCQSSGKRVYFTSIRLQQHQLRSAQTRQHTCSSAYVLAVCHVSFHPNPTKFSSGLFSRVRAISSPP